MAKQDHTQVGKVIAERLKTDPEMQAVAQRLTIQVKAAQAITAEVGGWDAESDPKNHEAWREFAQGFVELRNATNQRLIELGHKAPESPEEWEHIARVVGIPFNNPERAYLPIFLGRKKWAC